MRFLPGVAFPVPWWWLAAVFLAVGAFVYLPGYLLALIVHRKKVDPIVLLADTPVFGFVFFSVFALAAYFLGLTWVALMGAWGIGVGALAIVCWRSSARQRAGSVERPPRWLFALTASVAICLGLLSFGTQWVESGDSAIHLQALTGMAHRPVVSQPTYNLLRDVPVWDHAFDAYYPLLILLARASDLELYELWRLLSAVWILSLPFGVVSLARELGGSVSLALWAGAMTLLVPLFAEPVLWGTAIGTLVYPNRLYLWLQVPVALRFAIVALRTGERRAAVIAAIIISSSMLVHPMGILIFGLTLATYGLLMAPLAVHGAVRRIKRTAIQLAYVGALALPLAALKWPYGREFVRLCSQQQFHSYYRFEKFSESLYAFPFPADEPWTVFAVLAACAITVTAIPLRYVERARRARRSTALADGSETSRVLDAGVFAAASFLGPALIRHNPLVVPMLGKIISFVAVGRLIRGGQAILMFAFLAWMSAHAVTLAARRLGASGRISVIVGNTVIAAVSVVLLVGFGHKTAASSSRTDWTIFRPTLVEIGRLLEPDSVVLAPKKTATSIVEFSPVRVPTFRFNGPLDLVELSEENQQMAAFFSPATSSQERVLIAAEYGAKYALLDRQHSELEPRELHQLGTVLYEDSTYTLIRLRARTGTPPPGAASSPAAVPQGL